ncbi:YceI family protein [Zhongshania aquimaris]|uniref:YceI family protein n=1 Tax=Zhongshania aquimaris TaxID=2857107 RepID=A0ABS6VLK2_9GAMM|nr:YceI family protein [Zhongshania aquimaris]MBW2939182.1 YceI family protein [Zhongshania aquimaris]
MKKLVCALALLLPMGGLNALELVKEASVLNFVTVKNDAVAELMSFSSLTGSIDDATGKAELIVDLSSVETGIDIRNDRMREHLFQIDKFPSATYSATVEMANLNAMAVGEQKNIELRGELKLHGKTAPVVFEVIVTKRSDESFHAATSSPAFISANSFELAPGIGKLRSLAGLQNIDLVVPVTFSVVFQ